MDGQDLVENVSGARGQVTFLFVRHTNCFARSVVKRFLEKNHQFLIIHANVRKKE